MNRLHRDCFFFAATATLLAGCCTPAVIPDQDPHSAIRKTMKADGHGGIVEHDENLKPLDPSPLRDGFTAIGAPQARMISGANYPSPTPTPKRVSTSAIRKSDKPLYHIKYNSIMVALRTPASPLKTNAGPTSSQKEGNLWYRIWVPTDATDNIGWWSPWTASNGLDTDNSTPSLSGTLLEPGKWHLLPPASDKTITIQATVNGTQYTWTGCWSPKAKDGSTDPTERGSITWQLGSSPCQ
jgi:hypothetical protein